MIQPKAETLISIIRQRTKKHSFWDTFRNWKSQEVFDTEINGMICLLLSPSVIIHQAPSAPNELPAGFLKPQKSMEGNADGVTQPDTLQNTKKLKPST